MSLFNPGAPTLFDRIGILFDRQFNQFKSFSATGLDGEKSRPSQRFGMADHSWDDIDRLAAGLPWDMQFGLLNAADVNNAKGDLEAMKAQEVYWREYRKTQEQTLDTYVDVRNEQLGLAKSTLNARQTVSQIDLKASNAYYQHNAQSAIAGQQNANNADLARLQQELGIRLENHRLGNNRGYLNEEFNQETNLDNARAGAKRQSLADRYSAKLESIRNPARRESEFTPTQGRVLRFGRRAG